MNRRSFLKACSLTVGGIFYTPLLKNNNSELYKEFDWIQTPCAILYRIEWNGNEYKLASVPIMVKTVRLKTVTPGNIDLTKETSVLKKYKFVNGVVNNYTVHTNELLLNECKKYGFTHLYTIVSHYDGNSTRYLARGAIMPGWKRDRPGSFKIVHV